MKCSAAQMEQIKQDARYRSIGMLPSKMIPYKDADGNKTLDYDDNDIVYIRPFELPELRLVSKAATLNAMYHLIRAIDLVCSVDVYKLTIGDFYYVLLWLRMNSYPERPYAFEWKCDSVFFQHKESKEFLFYDVPDSEWPSPDRLISEYVGTPCNTENTSIVRQKECTVYELEDGLILPPEFDFPRVAHLEDFTSAVGDPELMYLADGIKWIKGHTFAEKLKKAEKDPGLVYTGLDINEAVVHGFSEAITFKCRQCRVEHTTNLVINALSFFQ